MTASDFSAMRHKILNNIQQYVNLVQTIPVPKFLNVWIWSFRFTDFHPAGNKQWNTYKYGWITQVLATWEHTIKVIWVFNTSIEHAAYLFYNLAQGPF